ncbi:hypothetical protein N836_17395 [Leptolyngbya sp. Heron Island J]|uniref:hypothetical protein n=1 Tax=Leptolyngbya sp. Heron Island J TaxID=1385935 RepID=UPI0003B938D1|nr:hypothetical protein [Leptolyngbya sp. Heron Island J]ESA34400.1 hypothetical protein N836_17395 [Leptolyngbya sp. Heron Island J]
MTVETLNYMMNYVIEGWAIMSATYLGVGFTMSFWTRAQNGLKAKEAAAARAKAEEVSNAERVAEVTAVAEKYGKNADKQQVKSGVTVPGQ